MLKKLLLAMSACFILSTTASAMQISTETYNVFPLYPEKIKKIDVSYGITMIEYREHHVAFYSIDDLSTKNGRDMAVSYHYFPKNVRSPYTHVLNKWIASAKASLKDKEPDAIVIPYPEKNGMLILHQKTVEGLYLLDGVIYKTSIDAEGMPNAMKEKFADSLINTVTPQ